MAAAAAARSSFGDGRGETREGEMGFRVLVYMAAGGLGWSRVMGRGSVGCRLLADISSLTLLLANFFFSFVWFFFSRKACVVLKTSLVSAI
jgi:hypothetical protein